FKAIPGVIDVTGWGGKTKTYEVTVDQRRLVDYGLSIPQVLQALSNANINVGGQTGNIGPPSVGGWWCAVSVSSVPWMPSARPSSPTTTVLRSTSVTSPRCTSSICRGSASPAT